MTIRSISKLISILFFFFCSTLFAEHIIDNQFKYSLDIPEGFEVIDSDSNGTAFLFSHPNIPVQFTLQVLQDKKDLSSTQALNTQLNKLKAQFQIDTFSWSNRECAITDFSMNFNNQLHSGWGVCTKLQDDSPIVILAFSPDKNREQCNLFLISIINSLCIDDKLYNKPGMVVSYAFPKEGRKSVNINFRGFDFTTEIDKADEEAAQFIVDMEYFILNLYGKHPKRQEAIQRYYRMIYRDNFGRLEKFSSDLLDAVFALPAVKESKKPDLTATQEILYWVQTFKYERNQENSDFTNLVSAVLGTGNDCDSRSMLVSMLTKCIGYESIMLVSTEYQHAMTTLEMNEPGMKYTLPGTDHQFLYGETTNPGCTWGLVAATQADPKYWVPVILP